MFLWRNKRKLIGNYPPVPAGGFYWVVIHHIFFCNNIVCSTELQIRGVLRDNSKIIFLISP